MIVVGAAAIAVTKISVASAEINYSVATLFARATGNEGMVVRRVESVFLVERWDRRLFILDC